jgi:hypothetical protein
VTSGSASRSNELFARRGTGAPSGHGRALRGGRSFRLSVVDPGVQQVRMWERGSLPATIPAQLRKPCRSRHPYAAPRTSLQCVCTRRRNCIEQWSPLPNYAPASVGFPALFQQTAPALENRCCTEAANPVGFSPGGAWGLGPGAGIRLWPPFEVPIDCVEMFARACPDRDVAANLIGSWRSDRRRARCSAALDPGEKKFARESESEPKRRRRSCIVRFKRTRSDPASAKIMQQETPQVRFRGATTPGKVWIFLD